MFFERREKMKKIILVVEDLPEEQARAKEVVITSGHRPVIADNLKDANRLWDSLAGKIDGILTDLHFPQHGPIGDAVSSGIAVVLRAAAENIPVVICTSEGHGADYFKSAMKSLEKITGKVIPVEHKNYPVALKQLEEIMKKEGMV
jgi:CheY-like chemotaxis protein